MITTRASGEDVVGQDMAIFFGFIGLQGNPMLIFIALFVCPRRAGS